LGYILETLKQSNNIKKASIMTNKKIVQPSRNRTSLLKNTKYYKSQRPIGMSIRPILLALLSAIPLISPAAYAADTFSGLGELAGGTFYSEANAISSDGSVVVGYSGITFQAFRWTQAGGMVGLGDLAGSYFQSQANAVSSDGSVVVGYGNGTSGTEAFRWTQAGGMVGLGDLSGGAFSSQAYGVSSDGSVVVGYGNTVTGREAFRWTQAGGMVGLGDIAGGSTYSQANAVNSDGSVVVGLGNSASGFEAFRWTQAGGMVGLGDLAGGSFSSEAKAVNSDGSVVVGFGNSAAGREAFRWTQAGGMVGLGDLAGGSFLSQANAVNSDGSVVVGYGVSASGQEAFRWTQTGGMIRVQDWLADAGVSAVGFTKLTEARGISGDGHTVVGYGQSVNGREAFIARVEPDLTGGGNGIIGLTDLANSMAQTHAVSNQMEGLTSLTLNGAHHRTLSEIALQNGQSCGWVSGDLSRLWRQANGTIGTAEVGACHKFSNQGVMIGFGVGSNFSNLDLANNGKSRINGQYGVAEVNWYIPNTTLLASVLGVYGEWDANLSRGYAIAGTVRSKGETDITGYSLRARIDWQDAFSLGEVSFSPRIAYSLMKTEVDGYREIGGSAPANFQDQNHTAKELRIGLTGKYLLSEQVTLLGHAEIAHRFDDKVATIQGNINALGVGIGFRQDGNQVQKNWARLGAEIDYRVNPANLISMSSFVASAGQDADLTAALSWKMLF
jgi:probable HAF family extracellular repeat protein